MNTIRKPTLRRNTVVLGSGTHCGAIRGAQSAEAGAGRCSGQERVWGQRRVPHSDARRVVGGIGDRGCCTTMPISPNPGAPGYAWRRFSFLEKGLWIGWSASPSASPSAVVISAVVGNRERQVDDGPPAVEQHGARAALTRGRSPSSPG